MSYPFVVTVVIVIPWSRHTHCLTIPQQIVQTAFLILRCGVMLMLSWHVLFLWSFWLQLLLLFLLCSLEEFLYGHLSSESFQTIVSRRLFGTLFRCGS